MSVVLGLSAKGAPGVSLGMWGLWRCWPRAVLGLEADPAGGSWALSFGLTSDPGLMDLAAEQGPIGAEVLDRCSIEIGEERRVMCAPRDSVQVRRALGWLGDRLAAWPEDLDVLVDGGRLDAERGHPVLARADAIVVWTLTTPAALGATAALLAGLDRSVRSDVLVRIVTVGASPYKPGEAVEALDELAGPRLSVGLGAALPDDRRLAGIVADGGRRSARLCSAWFGLLAAELAAATAHRSAPTLGMTASHGAGVGR